MWKAPHLYVLACLAFASGHRVSAAPPAPESAQPGKPTHTDCYGDPLPPRAIARMGTIRFRHADAHGWFPATFAPDSKVLATGGSRTLRFWDTSTGKLLRETRENYQLGLLHFSPDGRLLAVQGADAICLLDPATTKLLRRIKPKGEVLAFSPDSKLLATAGDEGEVLLWNTATGEQVRRLHGHKKLVHTGCFSADGATLLTICLDQRICRWNVATGERMAPLDLALPGGRTSCLSPDARTLAVAPDGREPVKLWDTATGKERGRLQGSMAVGQSSLAFSTDNRTLATIRLDLRRGERVISLWDTESGKLRRQFSVPGRDAQDIELSPDGRILLTKRGPVVSLWDTATGKRFANYAAHEDLVTSLAFTRDGRQLVSASYDGTIRLWDTSTGHQERELTGDRWTVDHLALTPDSKAILSGGFDGTLCLQELLTGRELRRLVIDHPPEGENGPEIIVRALAMMPDGKSAVSLSESYRWKGERERFQVWDLATGKVLAQRTANDERFHFCGVFSPNGNLFLGSRDGQIAPERVPANAGVEVSGKTFVVLQRTTTGQELLAIRLPDENGHYHSFAPDGRTLITTTFSVPPTRENRQRRNALRLWELASGKERLTIELPPEGDGFNMPQEAMTADGRTLAVARTDGVLQAWDVASGKELLRRTGCQAAAYRLAFSPDGKRLASGHADGTILIWDLTPEIDQRPAAPRPSAEALERRWSDLAGDDARKAHVAIWNLTDAAGPAITLLDQRLRPATTPATEKVRSLIADLDHEEFARREAAFRELWELEELAEPAVRAALQGNLAAEPRRRLKRLLETSLVVRSSEKLRHLRAIEVLEHIGSAEAQRTLTRLAGGDPEARLTQEAKASLERLARRPSARP
jgi:WD40 repeat protein